MSTLLLALALLIGLGLISFLIAVGLAGLGILLSSIVPLSPFQGTLLNLVLFSLAIVFLGVSLLFERFRDTFWTTADEQNALDEGSSTSTTMVLARRCEDPYRLDVNSRRLAAMTRVPAAVAGRINPVVSPESSIGRDRAPDDTFETSPSH